MKFIFSTLLLTVICISLSNSADTRLPTDVAPELYDLWIRVNLNSFKFDGTVIITIDVINATQTITLNAKDILVEWNKVVLRQAQNVIAVEKTYFDNDNEIAVLMFMNVIPMGKYELELQFSGDIRSDLKGLYKSSYDYGVNKKLDII